MIKRISHSEPLDLDLEGVVHVDAKGWFTTTTVILKNDDAEYVGTGTAKRDTSDAYRGSVGYLFALSRALRDVADHLELEARRESGEGLELKEKDPE